MIHATCNNCGKLLNIPKRYAGTRGRCKACGGAIDVPSDTSQIPESSPHVEAPNSGSELHKNQQESGGKPNLPASANTIDLESAIYSDTRVRVTESRVIIDDKTYAVRNITSVSMTTSTTDNRAQAIGCGLPCGVISLFLALTFTSIAQGGLAAIFFFAGAAFIAMIIYFGAEGESTSYHLIIASSSGEKQALTSQDKEYIEAIVASITRAIVNNHHN